MVQDIIRMVIANGGQCKFCIPQAQVRDELMNLGFFVTPITSRVKNMYRVTRLPNGF